MIPPTAQAARITPTVLREWLARSDAVRVLDVRTPAEFEATHIPGSYNVPLDTLREHRDDIRRHLDSDVVLVCRSGNRAEQAEQALRGAGLANVHVLDGGMLAWQQLGGPVRRGRQRWDLERQVRFVAGLVVLAGTLGSLIAAPLLWLAVVIGAGLTVAALTNSCLLSLLLAKLPYNRGAACDATQVVAQLTNSRPDPTRRA
jgi:rhodanese-related sulfurtransferase